MYLTLTAKDIREMAEKASLYPASQISPYQTGFHDGIKFMATAIVNRAKENKKCQEV